jgi:Transposase DDE domain
MRHTAFSVENRKTKTRRVTEFIIPAASNPTFDVLTMSSWSCISVCCKPKIEALFAELKNRIGLRRARLRGMKYLQEQFLLAATAQNLTRLVGFLTIKSEQPLTIPA